MSDNTNNKNKLTSISISKENYLRLKKLGYTGDTFNTVLGKILDDIYNSKIVEIGEY